MNDKKVTMPSIDNLALPKKDRGTKKLHGLVFYKDTWEAMQEVATSYGLSVSKYVEILHDLYLANNNNKTEE